MPGDLNSSIGYLDVQFGAMDIMLDGNSFDAVSDSKFGSANSSNLDSTATAPSSNLDLNSASQNASLDPYAAKTNAQSSISSGIPQGVSTY